MTCHNRLLLFQEIDSKTAIEAEQGGENLHAEYKKVSQCCIVDVCFAIKSD